MGNMQNSNLATIQRYFTEHKAQIEAALPKHLTPDRMARLAMTAFSQNRALNNCDPVTVFASTIIASQLGLEIGVAGQGFLVPYKGKCTFVPGWQGLVDLVSRSGRGTVWSGAVFEGDEFDWQLGDSPYVRHRPGGENDPDLLTHVYAVGRVQNSAHPIIEVWPMRKIWSHRDKYNKVGADHYSFKHPEMYARKVPLLQVLKYMPKSIELSAAIEVTHHAEQGRTMTIDSNFIVLPDEDESPEDKKPPMRDQIKRKSEGAQGNAPVAGQITLESLVADVQNARTDDDLAFVRDVAKEHAEALGESSVQAINIAINNKAAEMKGEAA
jgi:recombination protein RecT